MISNGEALNDQEKIDAIRQGGLLRDAQWRTIVATWGQYCCQTVMRTTGCDQNVAREGFSIAVVGVDKRIRSTEGYDFLTTATLKTYLTASSIYAANRLLLAASRRTLDTSNLTGEAAFEQVDQWLSQDTCRMVMEKALAGIGDKSKKILLLFNDGFSMKEIAAEMGFDNETTARKEKYKAQEKFKRHLADNPHFMTLLKENCYG